MNHTKFFKLKVGALINFAHPKVGIMRMLYNPLIFEIEEDDERMLPHIHSSIKSIPSHNFIKTRTYLNTLGLKVGWIVNLGQDKLQIHATAIK